MSTGQAYHPRGNNHYPRSWGVTSPLAAGAALFPRGVDGLANPVTPTMPDYITTGAGTATFDGTYRFSHTDFYGGLDVEHTRYVWQLTTDSNIRLERVGDPDGSFWAWGLFDNNKIPHKSYIGSGSDPTVMDPMFDWLATIAILPAPTFTQATPPSTWTPESPTTDGGVSPVSWWDADAISGRNDGDPVASWNDASGNGVHAVQANAAYQPTYKTAELNDRPVVRFAGDYLTLASPGVYVGAACTVFVVSKRSDSHFSPLINKDVSNGPKLPDAGEVWAIGGKAFAMQSADMLLDSWGIHTMSWDGASTYVYRHDGAAKTPSAEYTQTSASYATHMGIDTTWIPGSGDIAEILVYGAALSAADIEQVEAYLVAKWGV